MKLFFLPLLVVLCSSTTFARFAGLYILPSKDKELGNIRLVLEESGRFYLFSGYHYRWGTWRETDQHTAALTFGKMDAVDVYVWGPEKERTHFSFQGFGNKQAFVSIGKGGKAEQEFVPVFEKEPACSYENTQSVVLPRKEAGEITIALNTGKTDGERGLVDCYTYTLPGGKGRVAVVVNEDAFLEQRSVTITRKDKRYTIGSEVLEKQAVALDTLPEVLRDQRALLQQARIKRFREHFGIREEEEAIELLVPRIAAGRNIKVEGGPLFSIECPSWDAVPIDPPPPPRQ